MSALKILEYGNIFIHNLFVRYMIWRYHSAQSFSSLWSQDMRPQVRRLVEQTSAKQPVRRSLEDRTLTGSAVMIRH